MVEEKDCKMRWLIFDEISNSVGEMVDGNTPPTMR